MILATYAVFIGMWKGVEGFFGAYMEMEKRPEVMWFYAAFSAVVAYPVLWFGPRWARRGR